jgi:hypothetical protein
MSHPVNRKDRFLRGKFKGEKRAKGYWNGFLHIHDAEKRKEFLEKNARSRRNTTKLCSCAMCGNPRRVSWKNKLTMQERKFFESDAMGL